MRFRRLLIPALLAFAAAAHAAVDAEVQKCAEPLADDVRLEHCTRAIAAPQGPFTAWAYFTRGVLLNRKGEHARAISDFDAALRLDPQNANVLAARGTSWLRLREYERAVADLGRALSIGPENPAARHNRGEALELMGQHAAAIADFDAVLRVDARSIQTWLSRAHARHELRDLDGAMADYEAALALEPANADALAGRAGLEGEREARGSRSPLGPLALVAGLLVLGGGVWVFRRRRAP